MARIITVCAIALAALSACIGDVTPGSDPDRNPDNPTPGADGGGDTDPSYPSLPALDAAFDAEMRGAGIPGIGACIVVGDVTEWCKGYGLANIETRAPVTPDTPFMLASVSKMFSTAAVMHAVDSGQLDLDAPISNIVSFGVSHPNAPNTAITTRMLLTHYSGIADNWDVMQSLYTDGDPTLALGEFMQGYLQPGGAYYDASANFGSQPGATYGYSNIGAALSAHVLEAATASEFTAYSRQNLFDPLGLQNTSWLLAGLDPDEVAMPYTVEGGAYRAAGLYGFPDYPSGQLRASAQDVARMFSMMVTGGEIDGVRILEAATVEEMKRLQHAGNDEQALTWYYTTLDGQRLLGHNGAELGVATEVQHRLSDGVSVVILMNAEGRAQTIPTLMRAMFDASAGLLPVGDAAVRTKRCQSSPDSAPVSEWSRSTMNWTRPRIWFSVRANGALSSAAASIR